MTPEEYMASAIVKAGLIGIAIIPSLIIFPLLSPIILFLSIMVYFKEIKRADEELKEKKRQDRKGTSKICSNYYPRIKGKQRCIVYDRKL